MEEAGRRGESHGLFAAVNLLKVVGGGYSRSIIGERYEIGVVISHRKDRTAVFITYFDKLYNPPKNSDGKLLRKY